ncbi:unnamed protein product, partial [Amoebophrya sp. A25]
LDLCKTSKQSCSPLPNADLVNLQAFFLIFFALGFVLCVIFILHRDTFWEILSRDPTSLSKAHHVVTEEYILQLPLESG